MLLAFLSIACEAMVCVEGLTAKVVREPGSCSLGYVGAPVNGNLEQQYL